MRGIALVLALLVGACGRAPAIEGVYADRSRIVSSTCGPVVGLDGLDDPRATVALDDDGAVVVTLLDVHFDGEPTSRRAVAVGSDDVTLVDGTAACGLLAPSAQVVGAAVTGGAGTTSSTSTTTVTGPRREERLERVGDSPDTVVQLRQTLRFSGTDVCAEGRLSTVPPRDCEVTRLIDLRLIEACPADCQRIQSVRTADDAVFCACGGP
jgi:hypothetical protein